MVTDPGGKTAKELGKQEIRKVWFEGLVLVWQGHQKFFPRAGVRVLS